MSDDDKKPKPQPPGVVRVDSLKPVRTITSTSALARLKLSFTGTATEWKPGKAFEALRKK